MNKDLKKMLKALEDQGFTVTYGRNGHPIIWLDGRKVTTLAGTPSDYRSLKNSLSYLKRAGFQWPPRG